MNFIVRIIAALVVMMCVLSFLPAFMAYQHATDDHDLHVSFTQTQWPRALATMTQEFSLGLRTDGKLPSGLMYQPVEYKYRVGDATCTGSRFDLRTSGTTPAPADKTVTDFVQQHCIPSKTEQLAVGRIHHYRCENFTVFYKPDAPCTAFISAAADMTALRTRMNDGLKSCALYAVLAAVAVGIFIASHEKNVRVAH